MSSVASPAPLPAEEFGEKDFYLDEFRAHTLCFAVALADCERPGGFETLGRVSRELVANGTRLIILFGIPPGPAGVGPRLRRVRQRLQRFVLSEETAVHFPARRGRRGLGEAVADLTEAARGGDLAPTLELAWRTLRVGPLFVGLVDEEALVDFAQRLAGRLRVHKLVMIEPPGGIASPTAGQLSFMDEAMLATVLHAGEAEWAGLAGRRKTLDAIQAALRGGVHSVNLCSLEGLARELYTYEGSGTLFTRGDYCRVERLGIDDFAEVERLLARGQREGYLKLRSAAETARVLLNGYGATIGAHHLAGVCGLETEPYADERAGEIVGLYTITRFKGEGVGARLLAQALEDARAAGLRYVFACTVEPRAQGFFERQGFRLVTPDDVPEAKWVGYEKERRVRLKVYRRDLEPRTTSG